MEKASNQGAQRTAAPLGSRTVRIFLNDSFSRPGVFGGGVNGNEKCTSYGKIKMYHLSGSVRGWGGGGRGFRPLVQCAL
jgi:hypothetical protein